MFSELLNRTSHVMSKSSIVHAVDKPDKRQQHNTTHTSTTTDVADPPPLNIQSIHHTPTQVPTVTAPENIIQAETYTKNAQFDDDKLSNLSTTGTKEQGETSSRHVDSSNLQTFYQHHPSAQRWTKDHPLEQVIGNPSQSIRTRRQQETDGEVCMFALTVSRTEPKNIKEAMIDFAWIESMHEELHQFDRLDVWELVDRPLCKNVINLKWLWKNKHDEENTVICNKSHLVAKGYAQKEGIDFEESFAPVSRSPNPLRGIFIKQKLNSEHAVCLDSRKITLVATISSGDKILRFELETLSRRFFDLLCDPQDKTTVLQPHSSEVGFINHMLILKLSKAQVDQGSQIKMIQVKEMMQDNDLKNSKSKDKGSRSRSQSMNE
ncbi:retrovirus-related pol polyprotein from transposon TNT 1-94 [Tanacetum coccineum]